MMKESRGACILTTWGQGRKEASQVEAQREKGMKNEPDLWAPGARVA